jgi:hypothetical protein
MTEQSFDDLIDLIAWHLPENYPAAKSEIVDFEPETDADRLAVRRARDVDL